MQIRRLTMSNFRSVASGQVMFGGHTVLIGGNSVGKSTVCEALDLLLGPDRLSRTNAINEHDFHQRLYLDENDEPVRIELEVVLTDLTSDLETKYRAHREYWDTEKEELLDEEDEPEDTDLDHVIPALRIVFEGFYDKQEDEFTAETYFASPPPEEGQNRVRVSRASKREFGFIYLRALRTGARALRCRAGKVPSTKCVAAIADVMARLDKDGLTGSPTQDWVSVRRLFERADAAELNKVAELARYLRLLRRGSAIEQALIGLWVSQGNYRGAEAALEQAILQDQLVDAQRESAPVSVMNMHQLKGRE